MEEITAEHVWARSPLDRATTERIIASAGLPLAISEAEYGALCTTLATLALLAFEHALQPRWPKGLGALIVGNYTRLLSALARANGLPGAPPSPPAEWLEAMNDWFMKAISETPEAKEGRPAKAIDQLMYPKLLGFYLLAYGKDPAHTAGGPTERFLTTFFGALKNVAETVKIDGPEEAVASIEIPSRTFAVPTGPALRGRIREFYKEPETRLVREMLCQFQGDAHPQDRRLH